MPTQNAFRKFFDLQVPFFLPRWRRIVVVILPVLWSMVEFGQGATIWGLIFLGFGAVAAWQFWTADWAAVAARATNGSES